MTDAEYRLMCVGISDYHDRVFHEHAAEDMKELLATAQNALDDLEAAEASAEKADTDAMNDQQDAVERAEKTLKEEIENLKDEQDVAQEEFDKETREYEARIAAAEMDLARFEEGARVVLVALCSRATLQPEINASPEPIMALLFVQALGVMLEIVAFSREEIARLDVRREQMRQEHVVRLARETKPVLIFRAAALGMSDVESNGYTKQQLAEIIAAHWTKQARAAGGLAYWQYGTENMKINRG